MRIRLIWQTLLPAGSDMQTILLLLRGFFAWFVMARRGLGLAILAIFLAVSTPSCATVPAYVYHEGNTCNVDGSKPGFPDCLPPSGFYCSRRQEIADPAASGISNRRYISQSVTLLPSKAALGPAQPVCPPNSTRLVQEQDLKRVKEGVHDIAKQIGAATAKCEFLVEQLTHYPDGTFKRWYLKDPSGLGFLLDVCAAELDKIPTIPTFDDEWLAMAAKEAFEKGYGAGVDEVANRLFVIELAVDAIEMIVVPELVLAEMVATKAIRASIAGLRRMPIFVPGAMDGIGVLMKVAPKAVAKTVKRGSSRVLARAMKLVGKFRLPGEFCHHIVAHGDDRAKQALDVLDKFGIDVDDAVNGVFLPGFKTSPNPLKKAVHGNVHTNAYYTAINNRLGDAKSPYQARRILQEIADELEKGIVPK